MDRKDRGPNQKHWCYTLNNYSEAEESQMEAIPGVMYHIFGRETGTTKDEQGVEQPGTPHLQGISSVRFQLVGTNETGYIHFRKKQRLSALKKLSSRAHWEVTEGTGYENYVYCTKEGGRTFETGERPKEVTKGTKRKSHGGLAFSAALAAPTVSAGIGIIRAGAPRDYCLHGESIERNLKRAKRTPFTHRFEKSDFTMEIKSYEKAVLVYGGSGLGKTHWTTRHFNTPLMVSHIEDLKQFSPENDGIVFDDMSFKHWPIESVVHLLDMEFDRSINVRYGTVTIPAHTPRMFTHNTPNPFYNEDGDLEQIKAIKRRHEVIHVTHPTWSPSLMPVKPMLELTESDNECDLDV